MAVPTRRLAIAGLILLGLLAVVFLIGRLVNPAETLLPAGELRVGVDASYPPFASVVNGELVGLDVDLAYALGERIGAQVRLVNMGYDGLYDSLKADQVDVIISALIVDPSRTRDVLYTRHYVDAGLVLVSPAIQPITSMAELNGRSLALEYGSDADSEARTWLRRVLPYTMMPYELPDYALDAVRLGQADAAMVDTITLALYMQNYRSWKYWAFSVTHQWIAPAVRADRVELWMKLDRTIIEMAEDGSLDALVARWL